MTQKEIEKLFDKYSKENGKFNYYDSEWGIDTDEVYFIENDKIYKIERENESTYGGEDDYSIEEIDKKDFSIDYRMAKAKEYVKFYEKFKDILIEGEN